jgi:hypothetical protein
MRAKALQQFTKLLDREAGIPGDATHGEGVDRIVTRDGDNTLAVAHDDVLALTRDAKPGLLTRGRRRGD